MDPKTALKELKDATERAFALIENGRNDPEKQTLDFFRLEDGLHAVGLKIYEDLKPTENSFKKIRFLITPGIPTQNSLYQHPYPHLLYKYPNLLDKYARESANRRIYVLKNAEMSLRRCIQQDPEDKSLPELLANLIGASRAYAGYYERSTDPRGLSASELNDAIWFLSENGVDTKRFTENQGFRNVKKEDCQDETI